MRKKGSQKKKGGGGGENSLISPPLDLRLYLKLKIRVFLPGRIVAMVIYCVMKIILTCSPIIRQFCVTLTSGSTRKEWL